MIWYNSTITLPVDTVSVIVSQYNNTAVTTTSTIYGDLASYSGPELSQASSLLTAVANFPEVYQVASFTLANGTNGALDSTSIAWPTPYAAVSGFVLYQTKPGYMNELGNPAQTCAFGQDDALQNDDGLTTTSVILDRTYYEAATIGSGYDSSNMFERLEDVEFVGLDGPAFSSWVLSDKNLLSATPIMASCSYVAEGVGPPAVKIPVSVLTATISTTTRLSGDFPKAGPAPASPVAPNIPPPTAEAQPSTATRAFAGPAAQQTATILVPLDSGSQSSLVPDLGAHGTAIALIPSNPDSGEDSSPYEPAPASATIILSPVEGSQPQPSPEAQSGGTYTPSNDQNSDSASNNNPPLNANAGGQPSRYPQPAAALVISYAGSIIQPDGSSQYNLPGIGTIRPGGEAVTNDNAVYSLAASATALYSNGIMVPITSIDKPLSFPPTPQIYSYGGSIYTADQSSKLVIVGQTLLPGGPAITVGGKVLSIAAPGTPILTFGGSTYKASPNGGFVVAGQSLGPGSAVTVAGTPISILPGGGVAVVGTNTQLLTASTTTSVPILTIGGSTYTADVSSDFIIGSQTLIPGGTITISGTAIALPIGATAVVIGTSTEPLAFATITSPPQRIITVNGVTYTADASSDFVIAGQTLTPGGVVTVSGTPISYAAAGTDVVVGTSTEAVDIGGLILSGFGGNAQGTGAIAFTGDAPDRAARRLLVILPLLVNLGILLVPSWRW